MPHSETTLADPLVSAARAVYPRSGEPAGREAAVPRFLNRDLSWLEFNRRVLHEAQDPRTPLLERVFFLSIFTSNLDEFIMKRVSGLREQRLSGVQGLRPEEGTPAQLLSAIRERIQEMFAVQADCYRNEIVPELKANGIHLLGWEELTADERLVAERIFRQEVYPVLTPLAMDASHPFPFLSNLSISLGVTLRYPQSEERSYARVKAPAVLPQWIRLETEEFADSYRFVSLKELIRRHLDVLFPDMLIDHVTVFRVTRNAEVDNNQHDNDDLLEVIEQSLRKRRLEHVVRLEHAPEPDPHLLKLLKRELRLTDDDIFEMPALLDYTCLGPIASLQIPSLRYEPFFSITPPPCVIRQGDFLVHHPYESFDASVRHLVERAVDDPDVLAIKLTLYRTGADSPFTPLLIRAAEDGKQVVCLVELKARFDEQENVQLAQTLEKAGVHVVYGVPGLKTHTKTMLIVRRESDGVVCYAHIGTGNYHTKTARVYDDLGLFTCRTAITQDMVELFNYLTGRSLRQNYRKLLVAPVTMKKRFIEMIRREQKHHEAARPAAIVAKMNQLEDRDVCQALCEASQAGVPIDLVVRGFCVLRPGVPGYSENIRITSVIGRFLEHSRIYHFRNSQEHPADGEFFIGSADWMHRNLDNRVEAITPVEDRAIKERLWSMLDIYLSDHRSAWDMHADGTYTQRTLAEGDGTEATLDAAIGCHQVFINRARQAAAAT